MLRAVGPGLTYPSSALSTKQQNPVHLLTMPPIRVPRLEELVSRESPIKTPIPE